MLSHGRLILNANAFFVAAITILISFAPKIKSFSKISPFSVLLSLVFASVFSAIFSFALKDKGGIKWRSIYTDKKFLLLMIADGADVLAFGYVFENPRPDVEIKSISYECDKNDFCRLALIGIKGLGKNKKQ